MEIAKENYGSIDKLTRSCLESNRFEFAVGIRTNGDKKENTTMNQRNVAEAFIYKFIERFLSKGIGLVISVVLARLIAPETFGLLAIISVFINLAQTFVQGGLGTALVQNKSTEEEDYSTVFLMSLAIGIFLDIVLFFSAPLIARIYKEPALIWPLRAMALLLPIGSLNSVQNAKLQRDMNFKLSMKCNLIATAISGMIGMVAAYCGAELWALVLYNLTGTITVTICMLSMDTWYPRKVFSWKRAKIFWDFGWKMLVSGLLCSIYNDARSLIIGKRYSITELGYHNKGQQFPEVMASTLDTSVQSVLLPVMAAEQDSTEQLNNILLKALNASMFVVTPVMLGLASISKTLIPFLLTDKWVESIPFMVIFCLSYLTLPVMTTNLSLIKAMGHGDIYLRTEWVRRVMMLALLLITLVVFDSVMAIAIGFAVSSVLDIIIIIHKVKKLTGLGFARQMCSIWKTLLSGAIMAVIVLCADVVQLSVFWKLSLQITVGIISYICCALLFKVEILTIWLSFLQNKKSNGKR